MSDEAVACPNCGLPRFRQHEPQPPQQASYTPPPPPPPPREGSYIPPGGGYVPPGRGAGTGQNIPNYLLPSILVTFCCCLPLGVVAIIFAAQVNSKQAAGDIAGAMEASRKAKMFCWIAFGLGILINVIMFFVYGSAAFFEAMQNAGG